MNAVVLTVIIYGIIFLVSLFLTAVMEHYAIPILHKMKFGQFVREDGPESHLKKTGTPTMGGICMLLSVFISTIIGAIVILIVNKTYANAALKAGFINEIVMILLLTLGYGLVGFLDDYLKIKHKESLGLRAWQKLSLQIVITALFIFIHVKNGNMYNVPAVKTIIPFAKNLSVSFPLWLFVIFAFFVLLGTDNGTNLTDGLDGLLSFVTIPVCVVLSVISCRGFYTYLRSAQLIDKKAITMSAVLLVSVSMLGALIGFLIYNHYPAKIFMGDTGSLMVGGYVASCAMIMNVPLFILIFGFVYLMESISVILQVGYFKLTHGKRIFKMAPIHHHFEKCGWKETKVVKVFFIISLICQIIAIVAYR